MKTCLIDCEKLADPYCGLGQYLISLLTHLLQSPQELSLLKKVRPVLLYPSKNYFEKLSDYFPDSIVKFYLPKNSLLKKIIYRWGLKNYDVYWATHQDSHLFPKNSHTSYFLTIHDLNGLYDLMESDSNKKNQKIQKYKSNLQKKISRAQGIIYISQFTKNEVHKYFQISSSCLETVIYNGIPLAFHENHPGITTQSTTLFKDAPYLFSIGTVVPKKNFHTLIEMMNSPMLKNYHLIIAGTTFHKYAKIIEEKILSLNLQDRVHLLGIITHEEKNIYLKHASAFVFPSLMEGFGLPVVEAMAYGIPIVLSSKTSLPEIGGDDCGYFENFETHSMANTVFNAINSHTEEKKQALILRSQKFSFERASIQYLKFFELVLGKEI